MHSSMSNNSSPPNYPLLGKPYPSTCLLDHKQDTQLLTTSSRQGDLLLDNLNRSAFGNFKRRLTLEEHNGGMEAKKRIMLEEDHNIPNQPQSYKLPPSATTLTGDIGIDADIDTDNDTLLGKLPVLLSSTLTEPGEDPLPSPSESPRASPLPYPPTQGDTNTTLAAAAATSPSSWNSLKIINLVENFSANSLLPSSQAHLAFKLLSKLDRSTLSDINNHLTQNLKRDIVASLPYELSIQVLKELDFGTLQNCLLVNHKWKSLITNEFWKYLLERDNFLYENEVIHENNCHELYQQRHRLHQRWIDPTYTPRRISVTAHGENVVTSLQFDDEKIITGADDKKINIYNPNTGELLKILSGHEGGVWALKYIGSQIISGSTDRTVRVWDLDSGKCTHIFRGHTSTIRCMELVTAGQDHFIVTGSRDNTLHVWRLPPPLSEEERGEDEGGILDFRPEENPYLVCVLQGHTASVRSVTGHGNIIISGSYDHTVRVWDLQTQRERFVLRGHTDRIYSTVYDVKRQRCISASMDSTIRIWDLITGKCIKVLNDHTSLVGLLGLTKDYMISAAADGTLRGWNPYNFNNEFTFHHDNHTAITTFDSNSNILVSGSEGQFNVYDLRQGGKLIRSKTLLNDAGQIWSAKFRLDKCIVAVEKNNNSFIEILDFSCP